jgi:hypothetical protein
LGSPLGKPVAVKEDSSNNSNHIIIVLRDKEAPKQDFLNISLNQKELQSKSIMPMKGL